MNYHCMSEDLELLMKDLSIKSAIILGHSMGGKVAMTMALTKVHISVNIEIVEYVKIISVFLRYWFLHRN